MKTSDVSQLQQGEVRIPRTPTRKLANAAPGSPFAGKQIPESPESILQNPLRGNASFSFGLQDLEAPRNVETDFPRSPRSRSRGHDDKSEIQLSHEEAEAELTSDQEKMLKDAIAGGRVEDPERVSEGAGRFGLFKPDMAARTALAVCQEMGKGKWSDRVIDLWNKLRAHMGTIHPDAKVRDVDQKLLTDYLREVAE